MQFIKLTNLKNLDVYINPEHIGHMFEVKESISYGSITTPRHTRVGVTTHNNGGFEVKETPLQIKQLIDKLYSKTKKVKVVI